MKEADLVIYDLDGTLIDSSTDIAHAANRTLEALGRPTLSVDEVRQKIGWGVKMLLEQLMPDAGPEGIEEARLAFLKYYSADLTAHTQLYPGVRETIERFHEAGKTQAVATNKPEDLSVRIIRELGLSPFLPLVVGGDTLERKKPHPDQILKVLSDLGADPDRTVFVGDSPVDGESGTAAGVYTVGVTYGFRGIEELERSGFDIIIDGFSHLTDLIR